MQSFPSLNLLRSNSSFFSTLAQQVIERRQQENNAVVSFEHYSSGDSSSSFNVSKGGTDNKRPRVLSACDSCKKNKKACTGETPCKSCEKKGVACLYMIGGQSRKFQGRTQASKRPAQENGDELRAITETKAASTSTTLFSQGPPPPPLPPVSTLTPSTSSVKSDTSFSHFFVQDPQLSSFGYFGSTNVFATESRLSPTRSNISCDLSPSQNLSHISLPTCDQHYLLDVYCQHVDTFYPVFPVDHLKEQLYSSSSTSTRATSLNTLFFCALFARAAYLVRDKTTSNGLPFGSFSTHFISYAHNIRDIYLDDPVPSCSTALALVIMANHLECNRLRHQLPVAWKWAGEACTLALTMGLYAKESLDMDPVLYQLRLRTFWLTFITDYTLKTIHGRPFLFDEMEISLGDKMSRGKHPKQLQLIENEGILTQRWLDRLKSTIYFCKGAKKIIKFNYSPQQKMDQNHPYYRGYLTTMDHWIYDAAKKEDAAATEAVTDSTISLDDGQQRQHQRMQEMTPPVETTEPAKPWSQRLDQLNDLYFYADAMLLHKRYIEDDTRRKQGSKSTSFETCCQAAEQAIYLASRVSTEELEVLSTSPITLYSVIMALQVLGGCCLFPKAGQQQGSSPVTSTAELLFEMGYHALQRLPIFQNPQSMMYDTLCQLWDLYCDYCATKGQKNLRGEVLLRKPIINNSWSNELYHPYGIFLDTATHFIQQPMAAEPSAIATTTITTTALPMEPPIDPPIERASIRTLTPKGQEHTDPTHTYQLIRAFQTPIGSASPVALDTRMSFQATTNHGHFAPTGEHINYISDLPLVPTASNHYQHHTPSSNIHHSSSSFSTPTGVDPEVIPLAGYTESPVPTYDSHDLTAAFGLSGSLESQSQLTTWAIPTPSSFSSSTFSSLYSSPAPDMF